MAKPSSNRTQSETRDQDPIEVIEGSAPQPPQNELLDSSESVSEAVESSGDRLSEAVIRLDETISTALGTPDTITPTEVAFAIFVAFVGALSAYLFNYFHWKTVSRHEKQSRAGTALAKIIEELESVAVEYWLRDYQSDKQELDRAQEVALITKTRLVSKYVDIFIHAHNGRDDSAIQKLDKFKAEVFDVVTGGEFESRTRKASKPKALKISTICADANGAISSLDFRI